MPRILIVILRNLCLLFLLTGGRSSCIDNGHEYEDGEVFKSSTCGVCECLDGEITCINDFCGEPGQSLAHVKYVANNCYLFYNVTT